MKTEKNYRKCKMIKRTLICLAFTASIITGCEKIPGKTEPIPLYKRLLDPNFAIPDYASNAIKATGGSRAWAEATKLDFNCVVTFYRTDGGFYLTEHHYEIYPYKNSIRITAQEPLGKFVWQLSGDRFNMPEGDKQNDVSPAAGLYRDFAETVLGIITAPIDFLDDNYTFTKLQGTVEREGLLYQTIKRINQPSGKTVSRKARPTTPPYWSGVIYYQNIETSIADTILFTNSDADKYFVVRGYNYTEVDKKGIRVPTKIEIFITDLRGTSQQLLAEINFK